MAVVAWVYDTHYCWSVADNCRGKYSDEEEALSVLRGGRYENQNLCIMDLDTLGFTTYTWKPYYEWIYESILENDPEYNSELPSYKNKREYCKYIYAKEEDSPILVKYYHERMETEFQLLYDAGCWEEIY